MTDSKKMPREELQKLFGSGTILFNQQPMPSSKKQLPKKTSASSDIEFFDEGHELLLNHVFEKEAPKAAATDEDTVDLEDDDDDDDLIDGADDLDLSEWAAHSKLEELNPPNAVEVAEFSDEFVSNATAWRAQSYFYACKVPNIVDTYLLFAIRWDDNCEQWERVSWCAVAGLKTHESASSALLKHFAEKNIEEADDGWEQFLTQFLD